MFNGFLPPTENWSKLPHQFIEALPQVETIAEMKVILYILRHTWGYHDDEKKITIDEFCNGRKRRDGSRLDNGTGLSANAVKDGIKRAIEHGFISVTIDDSDKARIKKYYQLSELEGQTLTPDRQTLTPRPSNIDPRTEKETPEDKLEKDNPPIENLSQHFSKQSNLWPSSLIETQEWDDDCQEILAKAGGNEEYAKQLVDYAIAILKKKKYTYKSPGSLLGTIANIVTQREESVKNGQSTAVIPPPARNADGSYNI